MELTDNQTIGKRLKSYLAYKNITAMEFERKIDVGNGFVSSLDIKSRAMGSDKLKKISDLYEDLNLSWLIAGKGEMINLEYSLNLDNIINEEQPIYEHKNKKVDIDYEKIIAQLKKELEEKEYIIQLQKQLLDLKK